MLLQLKGEFGVVPTDKINGQSLSKYLTGMVTSVPPSETFSLIKNNILHQSRNYKIHFEKSNS
jgi:hypothetical protein